MVTVLEATANSGLDTDGGTTASFSINPAGTDRLLLVFACSRNSSARTVSSISFGAQSLTQIATILSEVGGEERIDLWGLVAPNTGSATVTTTFSGTTQVALTGGFAISGATQSLTPESSDTYQGKSNVIATNLTVDATTGAFVVGGCITHNSGNVGLGTGFTSGWDLLQTGFADNHRYESSYDANVTAGTLNPFTNTVPDENIGAIAVSIAQVSASFVPRITII